MVEGVQQKHVGGTAIQFYSLRVLNDNSIIFVPTANAETVGIRPVISSLQCKKLINRLSADFEDISGDWKNRSKEFMHQLQSGDEDYNARWGGAEMKRLDGGASAGRRASRKRLPRLLSASP